MIAHRTKSLPSRSAPWIKVCGIASFSDLEACARAGATHVGFNTWPRSQRRTPAGRVRPLIDASRRLGLVPVLLHVPGSELSPREMAGLGVWVQSTVVLPQGLRCMFAGTIEARGRNCTDLAAAPWADVLLLDSSTQARPGGTGETLPREVIAGAPREFVLAGGLTPENVSSAIASHHPVGVDAASGLERAPGRKEPRLIEEFCAAAMEAFEKFNGMEAGRGVVRTPAGVSPACNAQELIRGNK